MRRREEKLLEEKMEAERERMEHTSRVRVYQVSELVGDRPVISKSHFKYAF